MTTEPWDSGVQNERTRLAWQRTLMSGLTCSLVVARLLASMSLVLALTIGIAALASSAALGALVTRRYRANHNALMADRNLADAKTPLLITTLVVLTGVGALGYVLLA